MDETWTQPIRFGRYSQPSLLDWFPDWSTAEWVQVTAAMFAAIAAVAASIAAWVSWSQLRRSRRPAVSAGVLHGHPSGRLGASFHNAGPGVAVRLTYMVVAGNWKRIGLVGSGHLGAGDNADIDFQYATSEPAYLVWMCSDVDWNVYVWSSEWKAKRFSRRRWLRRDDLTVQSAFAQMHPDVRIP